MPTTAPPDELDTATTALDEARHAGEALLANLQDDVEPLEIAASEGAIRIAEARLAAAQRRHSERGETTRRRKIADLRKELLSGAMDQRAERIIGLHTQISDLAQELRSEAGEYARRVDAIRRELLKLGDLPPGIEVNLPRYQAALRLDGRNWMLPNDWPDRAVVGAVFDAIEGTPTQRTVRPAARYNSSTPPIDYLRRRLEERY
jgi:hypothetical protein